MDIAQKRKVFRDLHADGCFLMPNPWDAGSAKLLQSLGFKALASTSGGFAWSLGKRDNTIGLDELLAHLRVLSASVDVPVNADFEGGFAREPAAVGDNVLKALATGVCGLSIEDFTGDVGQPIYETALAVERIRAARAAMDREGGGALLVARTEGMLHGMSVGEGIDRMVMFAEAGADVLFLTGVKARDDIAALVRAVSPKPVSVLWLAGAPEFAEMADLGVRRVSIGGALARAAWTATISAAEGLAAGSFEGLKGGAAWARMEQAFR